jgi:hypothetical protein
MLNSQKLRFAVLNPTLKNAKDNQEVKDALLDLPL